MSSEHSADERVDPEDIRRIDENVNGFARRIGTLAERIDQLEQRVDQQQYVIDRLVDDLPTQTRSKREKLFEVVRHGVRHGTRGPSGASIGKNTAAGAANCSPRHALNLFDDLDEEYSWATKDTSRQTARLCVDLDGREPAEFLDDVRSEFPEVDEP